MINRSNTKVLSFIFLLLLLGIFAFRQYANFHPENNSKPPLENASPVNTNSGDHSINEDSGDQLIPSKVFKVLEHIRKYHEAPEGYVGGREFKNREHRLAERTVDGRKIRYLEWDVNPKVEGQNRGSERLVTGDDDKAWYTDDHYNTFYEVKTTDE